MARHASSGFTLIEMLLVVAIIAVLAAVVLTQLSGVRSRSRDAQRKSDLSQLRAALELYYNDYGAYPAVAGWQASDPGGSYATFVQDNYIPGLAPNYIGRLPRDPSGPNTASTNPHPTCASGSEKRRYQYYSNGFGYKLLSHCAPEGTMLVSDPLYDPMRPSFAWMTCSGGVYCTTW